MFQLKKPPIKPERKIITHNAILMYSGDKINWSELNNRIAFPSHAINPTIELIPQDCMAVTDKDYYSSYSSHEIINGAHLVLTWQECEDIKIYNERLAKWSQEVMDYNRWSEEHKEEIKVAVAAKKDAKKNKKKKEISEKEKQIARLQKEIEKLKATK